MVHAGVHPQERPLNAHEPRDEDEPEPCFAVVDVETTGLDPTRHRVIECAVVTLDQRARPLDEWSTLIKVPGRRRLGAQGIHGIDRGMLRAAPAFKDVCGEIAARLSGRVLVGHVLGFDLEHLRAEFERAGVAMPAIEGICTRELAVARWPAAQHHLHACCIAANIRPKDLHSALGDARATAQLWRYFFEHEPEMSLPDVTWLALAPHPSPSVSRQPAARAPGGLRGLARSLRALVGV